MIKNKLGILAVLLLVGCSQSESASESRQVDDLFAAYKSQAAPNPNVDIGKYLSQIRTAIQREMHDVDVWKGKSCDLAIKLNPDGTLQEVHTVEGDPGLCPVAKSAIEHAKLPTPPSAEVYERVKVATLVFKI